MGVLASAGAVSETGVEEAGASDEGVLVEASEVGEADSSGAGVESLESAEGVEVSAVPSVEEVGEAVSVGTPGSLAAAVPRLAAMALMLPTAASIAESSEAEMPAWRLLISASKSVTAVVTAACSDARLATAVLRSSIADI